MPLEIALRAAGAGLLWLTAAALLLSAPRSAVARWFLPLALGIAGFLGVNTAFDAAELPEPLWSIAAFCSRMAAVALWVFCLVLFDARPRAAAIAAVAGAWLALVAMDRNYLGLTPAGMEFSPVLIALGTGLVLHAGWRVLRDLRDDLLERRRRARPIFALALLGILAMDFAVDVLQGYGWQPPSFLLLQNGMILALSAGLALWLLRADPALLADAGASAASVAPQVPETDDPASAILVRLQTLMREQRPYLDPALTFAQFAAKAGVPEPALRRAINHRLGHGHFRNFLNEYRVAEARRRLRDPAAAGDKIVTVALESGFSSLASFNRAFRQIAGCSPSEYRSRGAPIDS